MASLPDTLTPRRTSPARWLRVGGALLLALLATVAGIAHVSVEYPRVRHILVRHATTPDASGQYSQAIGPSAQRLPLLVLRAHGNGRLEVRANGALVAAAELSSGASRRFDIQVPGGLPSDAQLLLTAPAGWQLDYLEAANVHGFVSGILDAEIVPADSREGAGLPVWPAVGAGVLLALLGARPPSSRIVPRAVRIALAVPAVAILSAALVAPLVSRFALVLDVSTWLLCLVLIWFAPAVDAYRAGRQRLADVAPRVRPRLVDSIVVLAAASIFFTAATRHGLQEHGGDYSGFLYLTPAFAASPVLDPYPDLRRSLVTHDPGYDGQLMFLMAFDPLMTHFEPATYSKVVDAPGYRYGRIGFPLLTRLFSGGRPEAFPQTMVWLAAAGGVLVTFFMLLLARDAGASPWQALLCLLTPGLVVSLARALPEPIAAAFLLGGLWAYLHRRKGLAVALWSASLLVRETGALLVVAVVAYDLWKTRGSRRGLWPLASLLPMTAWKAYVGWRLSAVPNVDGWWHRPTELSLPVVGLARLMVEGGIGEQAGRACNQVWPVLLVALLALAVAAWRWRPGPVAAGAVASGLLVVSFDYVKVLSWVGNAERASYEAFLLLFAALLPFGSLPPRGRWALAAFAAALFLYDFQFGTHCVWFRSALVVFD